MTGRLQHKQKIKTASVNFGLPELEEEMTEVLFTCSVCHKFYVDEAAVAEHIQNETRRHEKAIAVQMPLSDVVVKLITVYGDGAYLFTCFKCLQCQTYLSRHQIADHIRVHRARRCRKYTCRHSTVDELRSIGLEPDQQTLLFKGRVFADAQCRACQLDFMDTSAFWEHVSSVHSPAVSWKYCCQICRYEATSKRKLEVHREEQHFNELNSHVCGYSNSSFTENKYFQAHKERVELHAKIYPCDQCPKFFHSKTKLNCHTAIHANVRKYECDLCGQRFNRKHHMTNHRYRHTGEKPVKCQLCDKAFIQKASLNVHMKKHAKELMASPITYRYLY